VNVADDVERPRILALVGPKRPALDPSGLHLLHGRQFPDLAEALSLQAPQSLPYLADHALRHTWPEVTIGPALVSLNANVEAGIEHDRHRQRVPSPRQFDPLLALR